MPFANVGLVKLPPQVGDDQAIMLSDIFPTGYFGADIAGIKSGDTVAVFGCGPVGLFAIASAKLMGAGRIFAVDTIESRLSKARALGAEVIDFNAEDPVAVLQELTGGSGPDRVIDAVGVDANRPDSGPAVKQAKQQAKQFDQEQAQVAPETNPKGPNWHPGDAPSQSLIWAVESIAKGGTLSIIGVYPPTAQSFPIGQAMNKNIAMVMGNTPHRAYIPRLVDMVRNGTVDPAQILTQVEPLMNVLDAYKAFDTRQPGWVKVELKPQA